MRKRDYLMECGLPWRITKILDRIEITYLDELTEFSRNDLLRLRRFGQGSLVVVEARLAKARLRLSPTDHPRFSSGER